MPLSLSHLYNLFGILQRRFFSSLPFAHVFNSFFISVWIHGHYFILCNTVQHYFIFSIIIPLEPLGTPPVGSCWHSLINVVFFFLFSFLSTSFHFGIKRLWHLVYFLFQSPSQIFLQGFLFLLLKNGFRNQDLGASCASCHRGVISFRLSSLTQKEICKSIYTHIIITISLCNHVYLCSPVLCCVRLFVTPWAIAH